MRYANVDVLLMKGSAYFTKSRDQFGGLACRRRIKTSSKTTFDPKCIVFVYSSGHALVEIYMHAERTCIVDDLSRCLYSSPVFGGKNTFVYRVSIMSITNRHHHLRHL